VREKSSTSRPPRPRLPLLAGALIAGSLAIPALAFGHLERPSYWPDPAPDTTVTPAAGGKVPKARSLASAVTGKGPGDVRVVCKGADKSLSLALRSIHRADKRGVRLRPSTPKHKLSAGNADRLRKLNVKFAGMCDYHAVQAAIDDSHNNDRVVIMPGRYTEPKSRKSPVNDPECNPSLLQEDQSGALTPSYEYQATCSNDQNLIYVQGRAVKGEPLATPDPDRHGIPEQELGKCVRCNLQIDGSGARPEDVLLDAGKGYENAKRPGARPGGDTPAADCLAVPDGPENPCYAKHVVLRTDRSDGFVGRNFLMRGAKEHGFYTEETDGVLLDKVKFFWNADYGHLSFTTDHNVVKRCDGYGSGDAVVYPGAAPQTGEFRDESFYPEQRYNTVIKKCDLHGSAMGYSGSMGNAVRVTQNRFYGNANGLTSDTLSAPGHPGFPSDGMKVDHNWFYSNNLDVYRADNPFEALVPQAIGTGIMWPGMNDGNFSNNHVFDNWRHGTLLLAIPDAVAGTAEGNVDDQNHCPGLPISLPAPIGDTVESTSCDNKYFANRMGEVPAGFKPHPGLGKFGNLSSLTGGGPVPDGLANGVDFWWDESALNDGNCWYDNTGIDGDRASLTADPPLNPLPNVSLPGFLPENCSNSSGGSPVSYAVKAALLLNCFAEWDQGLVPDGVCNWYDMPAQPGTPKAAAQKRAEDRAMDELAETPEAKRLTAHFREIAGEADSGARPRRSATAGAICALALLAAGCGADEPGEDSAAAEPVGQELGGSVAQLVQCRDWNGASEAEKLATVEEIRSQVNREDAGVSSSALSDEEALEVFDNGCDEAYADGFRLHVLYARAAAFKPLKDIAEGESP